MVDKGIRGKGFIHISNYLPRIVPEDTPYIEIEWKNNEMPALYQYYYNYLADFVSGNHQKISSCRIPKEK